MTNAPPPRVSHHGADTRLSVLLFSKLNKKFFGYFDPENILLDNENT